MRYLFLTLFTFAATACSMTAGTGMDNLDSASNAPSLEDFQKSLQGTWERPCAFDSQNGYYKEALQFTGTGGNFGIIIQDYFYSDASCVSETMERMESLTVMDINNDGNQWTYSATVTSQTIRPMTQAEATQMNQMNGGKGACDLTGWTIGGMLDTTNTKCNPVANLSDTLYLSSGNLFRALDEIKFPMVLSGTMLQGTPYHKTH